jgi:hypothetical protein
MRRQAAKQEIHQAFNTNDRSINPLLLSFPFLSLCFLTSTWHRDREREIDRERVLFCSFFQTDLWEGALLDERLFLKGRPAERVDGR